MSVPNILWAQRKDLLYLTVDVQNLVKDQCTIKLESKKLTFQGKDSSNKSWAFSLDFFGEANVEKSSYSILPRQLEFKIIKQTEGPYWDKLTAGSAKLHWVKCDWAKWKDEDEQDETDFGNFGMGGDFNDYGGAAEEGDDSDDEDDDDGAVPGLEEEEEEKDENKAADVSPPD